MSKIYTPQKKNLDISTCFIVFYVGSNPAYLYNSEFASIELTNLEFCKVGSGEMRAWTEKLAMESIGMETDEEPENSAPLFDQKINYGIKQSLVHLAYAIRCRYPRFWSVLLPVRRLAQKILRIQTK